MKEEVKKLREGYKYCRVKGCTNFGACAGKKNGVRTYRNVCEWHRKNGRPYSKKGVHGYKPTEILVVIPKGSLPLP